MTVNLGVRDQLFLFAHHTDGRPRIHLPSLGVGLAAATLIDLVYEGRVSLVGTSRLYVSSPQPSADAIGNAVLANMRNDRTARVLGDWLRWLALDITARTGSLLHAAGIVGHNTRRPLLGKTTTVYRPIQRTIPERVLAAASSTVNGSHHAPPATMALCGLIGVLRLERVLGIDVPTTDLLHRLHEIAQQCPPEVRAVTSAAELLVGELATSAL